MVSFFVRMWREKPLGTVSGIIILLVILVAIFADVLAPYEYIEIHLADRLTGSSAAYPLGTDHLGRDLFSRVIYGARLSLIVGLAATALNVVVAVMIGGASGFAGGKLDLVVQRFVDAWMAIPGTAAAVDHHVHRGARSAPVDCGPGDIGRHRRFEVGAKRRDRHQGRMRTSRRRR